MALQLLDLGTVAGDETGTEGRSGGQIINDNFTELYTYAEGTAAFPNGIEVTDDLLVSGHAAIGSTASVDATKILNIVEIIDAPSPVSAVEFSVEVENTAVVGTAAVAHSLVAINSQEPSLVEVAQLFGIRAITEQSATSDMLNMYGFFGTNQSTLGSGAITGESAVVFAAAPAFSGGKAATSTGLAVLNQGVSGVTDANGLRIVKQSGATNNYGISLQGDDLGADIAFGAGQDVRMHYDGTNMTLEGSGIAAVGSTATINNTIPIDINGTVYHIMLSTTA